MTARAFAGDPVEYVLRDPFLGRVHASVTSPFYGPKIFYADELGADWQQAAGLSLPGRDVRQAASASEFVDGRAAHTQQLGGVVGRDQRLRARAALERP